MPNWMVVLKLLAHVLSGESVTPDLGSQDILERMSKSSGHSLKKSLPEFDKSRNYITLSNLEKAYVGSIVKRPLEGVKSILEYHYGVVMGTSVNDKEYILELTNGERPQCVLKEIFVRPYELTELKVHSAVRVTLEKIIERAESVEHKYWRLTKFNCFDFSEYCVYGILPKRELLINDGKQLSSSIKSFITSLELLGCENTEAANSLKKELAKQALYQEALKVDREKTAKRIEEHNKKAFDEL